MDAVSRLTAFAEILSLPPDSLCRLELLMRRAKASGGMNLEEWDGLITAVHALLLDVPLPVLAADAMGADDEPGLLSPDERLELDDLLTLYSAARAEEFYESDGIFMPLLLPDAAGKVSAGDWARGFLSSRDYEDRLEPLLENDEFFQIIAPLAVLSMEPEEAGRTLVLAELENGLETLIEAIPISVQALYEYGQAVDRHFLRAAEEDGPVEDAGDEMEDDWDEDTGGRPAPYRADEKIGRNDPCPCGSGKKYKKCCLRLHE